MTDNNYDADTGEIQEFPPETAAADAEQQPERLELASQTLAGDLRDFLIELIRDLREPWHKLTEKQQQFQVGRIETQCESSIRRAVYLIAGHDFTSIAVSLEQVAFKPKGVEAKLAMAAMTADVRHALVDAQGSPVMIVVADPKAFFGARAAAKIDRQEPELPLGEQDPGGDAIGAVAAEQDDGAALSGAAVKHFPEAREAGREDGRNGAISHQARYPSGVEGHADYHLGYEEGAALRRTALEEARARGAEAGRNGDDRLSNPYPAGIAEHDLWLAGWIAPDPPADEGALIDDDPVTTSSKSRARKQKTEAKA